MQRFPFGVAAILVALALVFIPPAFVNAQEQPQCNPTAAQVVEH